MCLVLSQSFQYVDLDEFLSENNIPVEGLGSNHLGGGSGGGHGGSNVGNGGISGAGVGGMGHRSESISHTNGGGLLGLPTKREKRSPSPSDCVSPDTMNPPSPADSSMY